MVLIIIIISNFQFICHFVYYIYIAIIEACTDVKFKSQYTTLLSTLLFNIEYRLDYNRSSITTTTTMFGFLSTTFSDSSFRVFSLQFIQ
jgi:hypothetical protein